MQIAQTMKRHPRGTALVAVVAVLGGLALYWFAPWNLVVDRTIDEAPPVVSGAVDDAEAGDGGGVVGSTEQARGGAEGGSGSGAGGGGERGAGPVVLASGGLGGLEHETSGTAIVIELEDGSRFLRLEDLETSNGPDLRVILTDQPVSEDWHVWDDGVVVDLGALKGNIGSSNYEIPRSVDLDDVETAVIWCRRFSVGFGVAPLEPAA
ncbi:MAG TPA: DM13 domain-containing protein [Actinomycetota bacterium]|nr:DM13 domain-containing protein [Actinomycetota bacterium]